MNTSINSAFRANPVRQAGPILRMVSRPFSPEMTRPVRFGSFAGAYRTRSLRLGFRRNGRPS